jgi:hypothetical protein
VTEKPYLTELPDPRSDMFASVLSTLVAMLLYLCIDEPDYRR